MMLNFDLQHCWILLNPCYTQTFNITKQNQIMSSVESHLILVALSLQVVKTSPNHPVSFLFSILCC